MSRHNLNPLQNILENIFDGSISDFIGRDFTTNLPSANIEELQDQYIIHLAAPGLSKRDFKIRVDNDKITISSEKEKTTENATQTFKRKEYDYSKFSRTFGLDQTVDKTKIDAVYNDGVLSVFMPKKETSKSNDSLIIEVK